MDPVKVAAALRIQEGRPKYGFLVLFPDRLVWTPSKTVRLAVFFGALGMLLTRFARGPAIRRAAEADPNTVTVHAADIASVYPAKFRVARGLVGLRLRDDSDVIFGVKLSKWKADLRTAMPEATFPA